MPEQLLPYLSLVGAVGGFFFAAFKYFDARALDRANTRFEQFHKVFVWVSGRTPEGTQLVDTQQAAAVYELTNFPEYAHISLPIVEYYLLQSNDERDDSLFRAALLFAQSRLRSSANRAAG